MHWTSSHITHGKFFLYLNGVSLHILFVHCFPTLGTVAHANDFFVYFFITAIKMLIMLPF